MQLEFDEQIKILEVLKYNEYLPARPVKDILTPGMVYYSPSIKELMEQDLSDRQINEVRMYLTRINYLDMKENEVIDRLSFRSAGRGDIEIDPNESIKLREARDLCAERIMGIMGLPDQWVYFAEHR